MSARIARLPNGPRPRPERHDKIVVSLSEGEFAALHRLASDAGLSMSAWLRRALLEESASRGVGT